MIAKWLARALVAGLVLGAGQVTAACSVLPSPAVSLGTISSLVLRTSSPGNAGGAGLRCGTVIVLLANNYIRVTLPSGPLVLSDGLGNTIPFNVYTREGGTQLQPGVPLVLSDTTILSLLTGGTGLPLFFQIPAGANVPAGTYTTSLNLNWQYAICENGLLNLCAWQRSPAVTQDCLLGICGAPTSWGTGSVASVQLTLVVTKSCIINSTPGVDLGDRALIRQFSTVTTTVVVTCTNTEGYTIGFDNGDYYAAPWRRMASGANRMNYNLYLPGTGTVWTTSQTRTAVGTGLQQNFQFDTTVDPAQPNLPEGSYIDYVRMIISY